VGLWHRGLVQVYGHRGCVLAGGPPENSVAAVEHALRVGAHGVEVDVRRTPAGALVCSHDPLPADEGVLAALSRLEDVLAAARGARIVLEVKNLPHEPDFDGPDQLATLGGIIPLLRSGDDAVISSFDFATAAAAAARGLRAAHLMFPGVAIRAGVAWAIEHGVAELHPPVATVLADPAGVDGARARGLRVVPYTAKTPDQALELARIGVDAVICDDPGSVLGALEGVRLGGHEHAQRAGH
jgi:glycerophosphoryl diester phosphodiesterase